MKIYQHYLIGRRSRGKDGVEILGPPASYRVNLVSFLGIMRDDATISYEAAASQAVAVATFVLV